MAKWMQNNVTTVNHHLFLDKMDSPTSSNISSFGSRSSRGRTEIENTSLATNEVDEGKGETHPPVFDSDFRWNPVAVKGRRVWYRKMDGMAKFILHWQHRFHNHGDIYVHGDLQAIERDGKLPVNTSHLREVMRRLRSVHPVVAMSIQQR